MAAEAFGTAIDRYALRGGATQDAPASVPHLAGAAGALVQGVAGLDSIAPRAGLRLGRRRHARARHARARHARARHGAAARARTRTHASGHAAATGPQACAAATAAAGGQSGFAPAQITGRYGLSGFYAAGDGGSGVTRRPVRAGAVQRERRRRLPGLHGHGHDRRHHRGRRRPGRRPGQWGGRE